jgi:RNA polymerase sigma-70 factor (ECF subfamily)
MATQAAAPEQAGAIEQVRAARDGDPAALGVLYDAFGAGLFRLAYRITGTREDAEDVVQDVFVGLPEALGHYVERGNLSGWLKRVTARVALMRLRASKRRREVALEGFDTATDPPHPTDRMALLAAVNALPDALRAVLVLKEVEGYSHAEISELLGISTVTSRVRLNRAMKRLRKILEDGR